MLISAKKEKNVTHRNFKKANTQVQNLVVIETQTHYDWFPDLRPG